MAAPLRKLLITGGTGKQGGAVISALLSSSSPFEILALTRNPNSASATRLAQNPNITIVSGDSTNPAPIFSAHNPIYGVFCMTMMGKEGDEEKQGKSLIDAALQNGVKHFVFTSVDRGGAGRSEENETIIPHFASKHRIEGYLKEKSENGKKMAYTILRPVAFMDNLTDDFMGKGFASMWKGIGEKKLQLISVHDIGVFAAKAFTDPSYQGKAISLAGDELNLEQAKKVFKETLGVDMPETYGFVGSGIKLMSKEMSTMFNWFAEEGYGADIPELRKEVPGLQDFGTWLKDSSQFSKKA